MHFSTIVAVELWKILEKRKGVPIFLREYTEEYIENIKLKLHDTKRFSNYYYHLGKDNERDFLENLDYYMATEKKEHFFNDHSKQDFYELGELVVEHESRKKVFEFIKPKRRKEFVNAYKHKSKTVNKYINKSKRLRECMDLMTWDVYEKNKLMDLQRVNRCKDRFCPNCMSISISKALTNFEPYFKRFLMDGYNPYMMTLTVPNVPGEDLQRTIEKMVESFGKLWRWLYRDISTPGVRSGGYRNRKFDVVAGVRALEITVEERRYNYYHPHFHVLLFLKNDELGDFEKYHFGGHQRKSGKSIHHSDADIHISKLWYMAYNNIRITKYDKMSENMYDEGELNYYMCDIRELEMPGGIYEVFKYVFKSADISSYEQFVNIHNAIESKRVRQSHGELHGLELDFDEGDIIDEKDSLEIYLEKEETPQTLVTRKIEELSRAYQKYRKISRFKGYEHVENIK